MQRPPRQFVTKLEQDLRTRYQAEYGRSQSPASHFSWQNLLKIFVPAFSGALVLILVLLKTFSSPLPENKAAVSDPTTIAALNEGTAEEEIINDFNGPVLNQIDKGISLAVAGNF